MALILVKRNDYLHHHKVMFDNNFQTLLAISGFATYTINKHKLTKLSFVNPKLDICAVILDIATLRF